jgi:two-component system cell cycle sensor histidine kinase/response regulator CckA
VLYVVTDPPHRSTLEETVAQLEATLESTHDGILVLGLDRRIIRVNRQFVAMFRLPPDVVARLDPVEMVGLVADQLEDQDALLFRSPQLWVDVSGEFLTELHFKDGRVFERFVSPQRIGNTVVGRVISYRDVSQPMRTEQALEQHRAFLEKAQEVAHIGSWVAELDGSEQLGWSTETHRIFGVPLGEFQGTTETFFTFVHADDRDAVRAAADAAATQGKPIDIVHRIVTTDGSVRWVHEKADVVRDVQGQPVRLIGTVQDVTERRQLEEQLRHAQKLDAIGTLAGGIAHDLNNALTAIAGYTELALTVLRHEHPARADVQEIRRAAERATSVTRQLLAFSRKQLLEPRVFDLNVAVNNVARLIGRLLGQDIHFRTDLCPSLPLIHADPGQIEQAIINLAVNARDAMPNGGELILTTSLDRLDEENARTRAPMPAGTYVTLGVRDTGHGMGADTLAHIFEPFFTTKEVGKGTGLGLAMVYGTVKQSGAFIFVESEEGCGANFLLHFPPAASHEPAVASQPQTSAHGWDTLLVVEDEQAIRSLVSSTLAHEGYRVLPAASAQEAVTLANDAERIDLLLTDASMPGASGLALARMLLVTRPDLPVIIMSGYSEEMLDTSGLPPSITILRKPFTPTELRARIRETLERRGAGK